MILRKAGVPYVLSIPDHRELKPGTLRSIIRALGLDVDEFLRGVALRRAESKGLGVTARQRVAPFGASASARRAFLCSQAARMTGSCRCATQVWPSRFRWMPSGSRISFQS